MPFLLFIAIPVLLSAGLYSPMLNGFFQQDEWFGLSEFIVHSHLSGWDLLDYFFRPSVAHFTPLTIAVQHGLFFLFGLNYKVWAIISLILHLAIVFLVGMLFNKLLNNKITTLVATLLFGLNFAGVQATTWVVANIATQGSVILALFSLVLFKKFLERKERKRYYWAIVLLIFSLLFKEITIGVFLIYGLILFWGDRGKNRKFSYVTLLVLGFYILLRLAMFFMPGRVNTAVVTQSQSSPKLVYNLVTIPLKSLSQSIIPVEILRYLSDVVTLRFPVSIRGEIGSPAFEIFSVKKVMEVFSLGFSGLLLFLFFHLIRYIKNKPYKGLMVISIVWILVNSLIFSFAPERSGVVFTIDSRNLYFISIATSLLLVFLGWYSLTRSKLLGLIFLIVVLLTNVFYLQERIQNQNKMGILRKRILSQIYKEHPVLPSEIIFFTQSNTSYYGLPEKEKIMPFQSGFGQTLLGWYYSTEKLPQGFFENRLLWKITDQGYQKINGRGFGYFRDLDKLKVVVEVNKLSRESVIAYSWNSKTEALIDNSQEIRDILFGK